MPGDTKCDLEERTAQANTAARTPKAARPLLFVQNPGPDPPPSRLPQLAHDQESSVEGHAHFLSRGAPAWDTQVLRDVLSLQRTYGNRYVQRVFGLAAAKKDQVERL